MNLLKIREMRDYLEFAASTGDDGSETLTPTSKAHGFEKDKYTAHDLRKEIEPWLTALFQSDHLSLLVGTGLTTAVHQGVTGELPQGFDLRTYRVFNEQIQAESTRSAEATGRGKPNHEDQLRAALRIADGLRILLNTQESKSEKQLDPLKAGAQMLNEDIESAIKELIVGVLKSEGHIVLFSPKNIAKDVAQKRDNALSMLVSFLMSFASRTGPRDRLGIFTTNYDRLIEFGSELAGIRLIDRFIGSLAPIFRASRLDVDLHYNPPGIRGEPRYLEGVARFSKLHGSLDWVDDDREIRRVAFPFGAEKYDPYLPQGVREVLVYPNDAKDRETAEYPYVELFRDFAAALCRPNSTLVTYGYSFGDDHVNRIIRDMLTIPSTHLVIINYDDTGKRLTNFYRGSKRTSQVSILIGHHLGDFRNLVDYYLPKPAIDRASIRMADLLRARGLAANTEHPGVSPAAGTMLPERADREEEKA